MGSLHSLPPPARPTGRPKPALTKHSRLSVEQARCFLMELDGRTVGADPMFLLGRLAEHAQRLLDVVDATVAP